MPRCLQVQQRQLICHLLFAGAPPTGKSRIVTVRSIDTSNEISTIVGDKYEVFPEDRWHQIGILGALQAPKNYVRCMVPASMRFSNQIQ